MSFLASKIKTVLGITVYIHEEENQTSIPYLRLWYTDWNLEECSMMIALHRRTDLVGVDLEEEYVKFEQWIGVSSVYLAFCEEKFPAKKDLYFLAVVDIAFGAWKID